MRHWKSMCSHLPTTLYHDDVIKWKHSPRYWPIVRGIHQSPVNSPHKGQWRGALMLSLIYTWINGWVNNGEAGDLRHHCAHYDVKVMCTTIRFSLYCCGHFRSSLWLRRINLPLWALLPTWINFNLSMDKWTSNNIPSKVWDQITYPINWWNR